VSGDLPDSFDATANIFYDGRGALDQLDHELFAQTSASEDSLRLLYRSGPGQAWQEFPNYFKNMLNSTTDRWGFVRIEQLVPGEYTFAKGVSTVSTSEVRQYNFNVKVSPNPARHVLRVKADEPFEKAMLINADGAQVQDWSFMPSKEAELKLTRQSGGNYWLILTGKSGTSSCSVIILE